ncbi:expressed unknown protein [Seminavis robusta]|uniref:Uncharacterized protein n=1 Tax=Seminavis robusta TaxID=568900 RepID=A0A9N8E381_9STRA|nr:expressed unknown protein [Seminavis robusta]|eukprot:Sro572_g168760.1 n/a (108) ;mRNA; f:23373-23696
MMAVFRATILALFLLQCSTKAFAPGQVKIVAQRVNAQPPVSWGFENHAAIQPNALFAADEDSNENEAEISDNFDAEGFGGYLAPYALAALASVVATGAFVKFVLLDY